jgi:hypothetical protein
VPPSARDSIPGGLSGSFPLPFTYDTRAEGWSGDPKLDLGSEPASLSEALPSVLGRMKITQPLGGDTDGRMSGDAAAAAALAGRDPRTLPPPIRYAGVPTTSKEAAWLSPSKLWLGVPHRSQFDGTLYAQTNCGPASLGMILEAYGLTGYPTDAIRGEVNKFQGNSDPDEGTSLAAIAAVAQRALLVPVDLYSRPGVYKRWTMDDLRKRLALGQPVITLTRYADLPGNADYPDTAINHYIVLSGLDGNQFIYNDAAYIPGKGRGLLMPAETLERAWANSSIPGQAVAFALGADGQGLLLPRSGPDYAWSDDDTDADSMELADRLVLERELLAMADSPFRAAGPGSTGVLLASSDTGRNESGGAQGWPRLVIPLGFLVAMLGAAVLFKAVRSEPGPSSQQ